MIHISTTSVHKLQNVYNAKMFKSMQFWHPRMDRCTFYENGTFYYQEKLFTNAYE